MKELKIKTPIYMGNGTWCNTDMSKEDARRMTDITRDYRGTVSANMRGLFALVCLLGFAYLALGNISPEFMAQLTKKADISRNNYEWIGQRGQSLVRYNMTHAK